MNKKISALAKAENWQRLTDSMKQTTDPMFHAAIDTAIEQARDKIPNLESDILLVMFACPEISFVATNVWTDDGIGDLFDIIASDWANGSRKFSTHAYLIQHGVVSKYYTDKTQKGE